MKIMKHIITCLNSESKNTPDLSKNLRLRLVSFYLNYD